MNTEARKRRQENVPGDLFVDHTCIDCDTCRWMAPETFSRVGAMSAVVQQPDDPDARLRALQALLACPTASIRTEHPPTDIAAAHDSFPLPIDEEALPGVFHCGYHSRESYAAASYFIRREGGNILVDSPRFNEKLAKRLEMLGGVKYMFLTHQDDVAGHDKWHARFGCERIIHEEEVSHDTRDVERKLTGSGPWPLVPEAELIFTPGHTSGCVSLLWKPGRVLFTGDHLCYSWRLGRLSINRGVNWFSVPVQLESVKALLPLDFLWILPGHGRRYSFRDFAHKNVELEHLLQQEGALASAS